jgi:hypothetical protein
MDASRDAWPAKSKRWTSRGALGASFASLRGECDDGALRHAREDREHDADARRRERAAMKCRMCSTPLTRAGRLCRECEHERVRVRQDAPAQDGAELLVPESRIAEIAPRRPRLRARSVVALAFCAGILGAAGVRFALVDEPRAPTRSIMLEPGQAVTPPGAGQRAAVKPR